MYIEKSSNVYRFCFQFHLLDSRVKMVKMEVRTNGVLSIPFIGFRAAESLASPEMGSATFQFHLLDSG